MLLERNSSTHDGKTIKSINGDLGNTLNMNEEVVISFTDGSQVILRTDYRGDTTYISEYEE